MISQRLLLKDREQVLKTCEGTKTDSTIVWH